MNKERLLRLASRLDKVAKEHFHLPQWYRNHTNNRPAKVAPLPQALGKGADYNAPKVILEEGFCGSAACVLGHAALIKDFNEQGLFVSTDNEKVAYWDEESGSVLWGFEAGAKFFDIPWEDATILFYGVSRRKSAKAFYTGDIEVDTSAITPQQVADALRQYVATDGESIKPFRPSNGLENNYY